MKTRLASLALASLLVGLAACGDAPLVSSDTPPAPAKTTNPTTPAAPVYALALVGNGPPTLAPYATQAVTVRLTKDGAPYAKSLLDFKVVGDAGGAQVSVAQAITEDGTGEATVDLTAGGGTGAFALEVDSDLTDALTVPFQVVTPEVAPASLDVEIAYPDQGVQPVDQVEVALFDASKVGCDVLGADPMPTALRIGMLTDIASAQHFDGLDGDKTLTIVALGSNPSTIVADGCTTGVTLGAGMTSSATVQLGALPLDPTGVYGVTEHYDMSNAMPGAAGQFISTLANMFDDPDDPGRYIVTLIEQKTGFNFGFLEQSAINLVQNFIHNNVPPRFLELFQYISDAARVVTNLTAKASINVHDGANGALAGDETWHDVVFTWRGDCNPAASPGCDVHDIALRNTQIGELHSSYPVDVTGGVFHMEAHDRTIPYARFFHLFVMQIVYPYIVPGATSTADVLQGSIDCTAVASQIDASDGNADGQLDLGFAQIPDTRLTGMCNDVLAAAGIAIDAKLDQLAQSVPSTVHLQGAANVVDADHNLVPEALTNGVLDGTITVDSTDYPVTGSFAGKRTGPVAAYQP